MMLWWLIVGICLGISAGMMHAGEAGKHSVAATVWLAAGLVLTVFAFVSGAQS
jgi:hypothetical protein